MKHKRNSIGFDTPEAGGDGFNEEVEKLRANPDGVIDIFEELDEDDICAYIDNMSKLIGEAVTKDMFDLAA
jgi:hypothetical protein